MKKILFIDRDGTIIKEPPVTQQVDTLEQLEFLPGAIRNLYRIAAQLDYELVMVTNQDGLGTEKYPQQNFDMVQGKMMEILQNEGIFFSAVHVDKSYPYEQKDTRKPGTGMLRSYMSGSCNLAASFVIGDRLTDVQLAQNLGAQAILIRNNDDPAGWEDKISLVADTWDEIYRYLAGEPALRKASVQRNTAETQISIELNLDGTGLYNINTGLGFFDHMLEQLARHGGVDLMISTKGDLHVDEHHTIEDTALALGKAFNIALGEKRGIERYGYCLPMDDCITLAALDFGGRSWINWHVDFARERIGDVSTEMFYHFFKSFCDEAKCNLYIKAAGENEHHKIESIFKAFARAVKKAVRKDKTNNKLPTTKGVL
ncbi:bifunctional histidinol-phosphatase/imidazoleglycerol-phosphate dehydratase HisB [Chitinophagaceae bacterium MMS25-I14]